MAAEPSASIARVLLWPFAPSFVLRRSLLGGDRHHPQAVPMIASFAAIAIVSTSTEKHP